MESGCCGSKEEEPRSSVRGPQVDYSSYMKKEENVLCEQRIRLHDIVNKLTHLFVIRNCVN